MWGTSLRQRLRLAPLYIAMRAADRLPATRARSTRLGAWAPGLTVIIPERDAPQMLEQALTALYAALEAVDEPAQVIVVANGAPKSTYDEVAARFPSVEWAHDEAPLGFAGAIERGLALARFEATYLLNNDMVLEPHALAATLALREADVFAVTSQILQRSESGRREESGFTDWYVHRDGVHLYHAPVADGAAEVVANLCAGGGASLFRTALLREYLADSRCYDPFYWEDVEWSVRAWRDGYRVLFCPASIATHRHRATTTRFYAEDELARIVERNRMLFEARHAASGFGADWTIQRICGLPYASQREIAHPRQALAILRQRRNAKRAPQPLPPPKLADVGAPAVALTSSYSFRLRAPGARRRILLVTPFAAFPPRHGGARRVAELVRGLRETHDIALVTDEASLYDARSFADFDGLSEVHLVERVSEANDPPDGDLAARMRRHCHPALAVTVASVLAQFRPGIVQIEHAELAPLIRHRSEHERWVLDLHDAFGPQDFADPAAARAYADDLARYDAVLVCSDEDRKLFEHRNIACVANGAQLAGDAYRPSASEEILFIGPFRYGPNREGIRRFLGEAWPRIRAARPSATLTILAGDEHVRYTQGAVEFAQPDITVLGHRDDVPALLSRSALTVNPLTGIRGSAVKLVESLAAGRVCVSTRDGARGMAAPPSGLVVVEDVASMADPIAALLADPVQRHRLEAPALDALAPYGWPRAVASLRALHDDLLRGPSAP